jgi:hypothetical protein
MNYATRAERIQRLLDELALIDRFGRQVANDPGNGYEVAIGRRARKLRRTEILAELNHLRPQGNAT